MLAAMLRRFRDDESGAVTTDWVVLTAGIVGLGLVAAATVANSTTSAAGSISTDVSKTISAAASSDYSSDATVEEPAPHEMTTAEFLASYEPLATSHRGGSGSDSWVRASYNYTSGMTDAQLLSSYNYNYAQAISGNKAVNADRLAVRERVMKERGIAIPSGNQTASQVRNLYI